MIDRPSPSAPAVFATSAIAAGGMLAHNVLEFGPAFLVDPQTLIPLAIFAALAIIAARETAGRAHGSPCSPGAPSTSSLAGSCQSCRSACSRSSPTSRWGTTSCTPSTP